nr:uncharacterized protein LOC112017220 [Quercus suber]
MSFTPLTAPIDQVLMKIKDEGALTFPGKLKGDPNKRSKDKYYRFHCDHGYDTADYYNLKQQIETLIRQVPQQENERSRLPVEDIRMIVLGTTATGSSRKAHKTYLRMVKNVQLTGFVPKMARIDNPIIEFSKEDVKRFHHPLDDALVVSISIGYYNTHRVLVDNESSADILYYPAFQQIRINREWLVSTNAPLVGFGGTKVYPLSTVTLPITIGDYPPQITKDVTFLVIDCLFTYNAIIGRPTLNSWKTITSTYHLIVKFLHRIQSR